MRIQPTSDNVILEIEKPENKTQSGIIIASKTQDKPDIGTIVAIGPGRILNSGELLPSSLKVGDKVIFNKFAGTEINANDKIYLMIKENDVLAIIS